MKRSGLYRFTLAVGLSVWAGGGVAADADARLWLERMAEGAQSVNYIGSFIYQRGARVNAMRIVHAAGERGEREKLSSLSGPMREVVRDNRAVTCILGDQQSVMVNKSRPRPPSPAMFPKDIDGIERYYRFVLDGTDRVAGRPCQVVALVPRDIYRYGRKLCLDEDRNLLLRSELTDNQGQVIELVMFTEIEFPETIDDDAFKTDMDEKGFRWVRQPDADESPAPVSADDSAWAIGAVPDGFALMDYMRHHMGQEPQPVDHWIFGDGLASVSVYVEMAKPGENAYSGVSSRGGLNAFGSMHDGYHVTVVGEVPLATLELIGKSVQKKP